MKVLKLLLYPLAALYNLGTRIRNHLYDVGHKPSFTFEYPVIAVGNLNVGGSGKTPMVEYIIRLLKQNYVVTTLSRGYGRQTSGYRKTAGEDTAQSVGDEPFQLFMKFGAEVHVVVGEDRVYAIPHILQDFPDTQVIVLDDALQHRSVKPGLSVLVTEYARPFFEDFVMPFGRLREARRGASRADVIVVTKCKDLSEQERTRIKSGVARYAPGKPVFFSRIVYDHPVPMCGRTTPSSQVVLVTGIAKTDTLMMHCLDKYQIIKHFRFPDHHRYREEDLARITAFLKGLPGEVSVITTEKDMVKLIDPGLKPMIDPQSWFYLPIRNEFIEDGLKFDEIVLRAASAGKI